MLGTVNPLGERARNSNWAVTIAFYALGATLAGASVGLVAGLAGHLAGVGHWPVRIRLLILGMVVLLAVAAERGVFGLHLPSPARQVDDRWISRYRGWVYGGGFGLQLGAGLLTQVNTSALYATGLAAGLTGSPRLAGTIGTVFGFTRGAAGLLSGLIRSENSLRRATLAVERSESIALAAGQALSLVIVASLITALAVGGE